jgi:hypothetical protein
MALASGIQAIGESADAFRNMKAVAVNAFNAIKGAIGATGIGLLVIALGTIVAYWDDIKGAVSGVSEEQKKLNKSNKLLKLGLVSGDFYAHPVWNFLYPLFENAIDSNISITLIYNGVRHDEVTKLYQSKADNFVMIYGLVTEIVIYTMF